MDLADIAGSLGSSILLEAALVCLGARLVQIIGRRKGKKVSLQLIMDEPPEALYNQWIKDRIEYYKRVEPVAPQRDEQLDLGF